MLRHNQTENNLSNTTTTKGAITMKSNNNIGSALEALPKQFVSSMKTLFDILDDQHTGFVRFSDIQKGWQDDGSKGLPHGVLDALHKVTPPSGLLSFERFCAGLKLCLLRNQSESFLHKSTTITTSNRINKSPLESATSLDVRSPSVPLMHMQDHIAASQNTAWNNTLSLHAFNNNNNNSNSILQTQRTLSLPQLSPNSELEDEVGIVTKNNMETTATITATSANVYNSPPPPPKPPRASATISNAVAAVSKAPGLLTTSTSTSNVTNSAVGMMVVDKTDIRHALQNLQMGILLHEMESKELGKHTDAGYRGSADGGSSSATDSGPMSSDIAIKKISSKRREPRRHTLQNGIDYNLLKRRLKQFEEERDVLLLGLEAVEKARTWYAQQLSNVQEKIKYLGRMGTHVEQWSEVQQERLNFQRARVLEINRNLQTLTDSWEQGEFPIHFNLAIRPSSNSKNSTLSSNARHNSSANVVSERLRQQNRLLSSEVNFKSERISLLEREKQMLMHELYELQQRQIVGCPSTATNGYLSVLGQNSPGCSSSSGALGDADVVY